jgi:hypothetical protein
MSAAGTYQCKSGQGGVSKFIRRAVIHTTTSLVLRQHGCRDKHARGAYRTDHMDDRKHGGVVDVVPTRNVRWRAGHVLRARLTG